MPWEGSSPVSMDTKKAVAFSNISRSNYQDLATNDVATASIGDYIREFLQQRLTAFPLGITTATHKKLVAVPRELGRRLCLVRFLEQAITNDAFAIEEELPAKGERFDLAARPSIAVRRNAVGSGDALDDVEMVKPGQERLFASAFPADWSARRRLSCSASNPTLALLAGPSMTSGQRSRS